jgi:hypothetical protein
MIEVQTKIYNKILIYGRLTAVLIMANKTTVFLEERFLLALVLFPHKHYVHTHSFYRWEENPPTSKHRMIPRNMLNITKISLLMLTCYVQLPGSDNGTPSFLPHLTLPLIQGTLAMCSQP